MASRQRMWMPATALTAVFMCTCLHHLPSPAASAAPTCQNGGIFDPVMYTCVCPAHSYGALCENLFTTDSPCQNMSTARLISDPTGTHRAGNAELCTVTGSCTGFSTLAEDWYRFESPAGNYLPTDFPCRYGDTRIYCGIEFAYTLRHLMLEFDDANGTKLYSARAYRYDTSEVNCYNPANMHYPVRVLMCPDNSTVYYLGPTSTSSHGYCIGDASIGSSSAASVSSTTEATTASAGLTAGTDGELATPTDGGLATPTDDGLITTTDGGLITTTDGGLATTTDGGLTTTDGGLTTTDGGLATTTAGYGLTTTGVSELTTGNDSNTQTTTEPTASVTTQPADNKNDSHTAGWNLLANDSHPCLPVLAIDNGTVQHLSCSIRTNSLQAKLGLSVAPAVVHSSGSMVCCNLTHVLRWLAETNRVYVNCLVEVVNITGHSITSSEVTVCRNTVSNSGVRYLTNRGQCAMVEATLEPPAFWYQWFGVGG